MFTTHRRSRPTRRPGLALAALATLGLVTAACSSGGGGTSVSLGAASTVAPAVSAPGSTAAGAAGSPAPGTGGTAATTPATPATPTTGATSGTAPGTHSSGAPAAAPAAAAPKAAPASTGPAPAAAGTYSYTSVGTSTITSGKSSTTVPMPSVTTLVVSSTANSSTLQWNPSGTSENLAFNGAGVFLTSETVPLVGTTCSFAAPVASPPWPPAAGQTFSGQASCGQGSLSLNGSVGAPGSVTLNGRAVSTVTVDSTLALAGTNLVVHETDLYAPSLRLPVAVHLTVSGSTGSASISSDARLVLDSSVPS